MEYSQMVPLHIAGGAFGLMSGAAALWFKKGSQPHRMAGNVFFMAMLIMSGTGAVMAYFEPAGASVLAGLLTFYMVLTGWMTVKRPEKSSGLFEKFAMIAAAAIAAYGILSGLEAINSADGRKDGFPAAIYFVFGGVAALGGLSDLSAILRKGVAGVQRIARHLWRMCYALFMAAASFFLGQQKVFPEALQGSFLLTLPVLVVIALLFFWLFKVLLGKKFRAKLAP